MWQFPLKPWFIIERDEIQEIDIGSLLEDTLETQPWFSYVSVIR